MTRKQRKSIFQKIIITTVICLSALSMPISVLAYQPVSVYTDDHDHSNTDVMYITFDDRATPLDVAEDYFDFSLSDNIIIDEYGNQYIIPAESTQSVQACTHEYASGTRREHVKNGNGCIVYVYQGTYCIKCGSCLQESLASQASYATCPH